MIQLIVNGCAIHAYNRSKAAVRCNGRVRPSSVTRHLVAPPPGRGTRSSNSFSSIGAEILSITSPDIRTLQREGYSLTPD